MRKVRLLGIVLIMITALACNLPRAIRRTAANPTATPYVMCTPPACKSDEVYYCAGECPGGCGTTCVTLTAPPPTPTLTPQPTYTPYVMCTPPACRTNEVYHCSGECLGGCGTTCATPTPGACANTWVPELAAAMQGKCPDPAEIGWAAQQPFEHGFMLWLQPSQSIYVFFDNGEHSFQLYADNFKEGDPEFDASLEPPVGLHQPIRGFGLIWRTYPEVRDKLGWATAPETGFNTWLQRYQIPGTHDLLTWVKDINQTIYQLNPTGNAWEVYTP